MAEKLDLTTPITRPTNSFHVTYMGLDWKNARITIDLEGDDGSPLHHTYEGAKATTLMTALNKANLSIKSLHRRIIEQLVTDGFLAGNISGAPD